MAFRLTPEALQRVADNKAWHETRQRQFAQMTDATLLASTEMFMAQCEPKPYTPGEPVYDATLWHVILPELMRRVRNGRDT